MPWSRTRRNTAAVYRTAEHRQARAALLAAFTPGDLCCLCQQPMWPPTRNLHADHDPVTGEYRGLAHAQCNVQDGARRGRARQNTRRLSW
jgi:hypothetical protein